MLYDESNMPVLIPLRSIRLLPAKCCVAFPGAPIASKKELLKFQIEGDNLPGILVRCTAEARGRAPRQSRSFPNAGPPGIRLDKTPPAT